MSNRSAAASPPGLLRLLVVFHESEALGAGRSVLNVLNPLRDYGWAVSGWFPGEGPLLDECRDGLASWAHRTKPLRYSVRGWRSRPGIAARAGDAPTYLRAFREFLLRTRPHVVHANTLRTLPEAMVAARLGVPVVMHVHEHPQPGPKRALAFRAATNVADVIVAVSDAVAATLEPGARKTPVVVAHNGVHAPETSTGSGATGVVGTVGTICRAKGTDVFLDAAALSIARDEALRFEHVGQSGLDEDVDFERSVSLLANSQSVKGSVRLLGGLPAHERLNRWELFVLASREDAFPLATLEAMAAGVPVIATRVGGLPEQIEHLESGILVEPEDPSAIAEWILRLHGDPGLRDRLAANAHARVQSRFTVERQAAALHRAYLGALNLRHGPPPVRARTLEAV